MRRFLGGLAAVFSAVAAYAVPAELRFGDQRLAAASCGVRSTLWIEHYTVALYLPGERSAAQELIDSDNAKALRMRIINRLLMPSEIPSKWREPMKENLAPAQFARATEVYQSLQPGDRLTLAYTPEDGVLVRVNGRLMTTLPGHRLIDALLETWADGEPLREKLDRTIARNPCGDAILAKAADTSAAPNRKTEDRGGLAGLERPASR